jgi:FkbM family methyltransferase
VEPAASNQARLSENLRANGATAAVKVIPCAVGKSDGEGDLALASPHNRVLKIGASASGFSAEKVRVLSLATLLEESGFDEVDFMKVDCEGAEYDFFAGAREEDLQRIRALSLEFHDGGTPERTGWHLRKFLQTKGFHIVHCHHDSTWRNLSTGKLVAVRD